MIWSAQYGNDGERGRLGGDWRFDWVLWMHSFDAKLTVWRSRWIHRE
jgi:hypothetical protein